jgi:ribulose-phosphate 3-epimerase
MTQVLPAIIPKNKTQLEEEMNRVSTFAKLVQVDIADGTFAPVKTWPYNGQDTDFFDDIKKEDAGWPKWEHVDVEVHFMIDKPEEVLLDWIHTGVVSIVAHIEATENFQKIIDTCREYSVAVGIALKPSTDISRIAPFVEQVDFIQVMGSDNIGHHGVTLENIAVEKIKTLHEMFPERIISIDIGVTEETAKELVLAGATKLIVGSAILDADNPQQVFEDLTSL